ncbi:MAG: ATP-binding protein [Desulfobacterales bacterium]
MNESIPLYNSRITKIYVEYLQQYYPDIDLKSVLDYAGMSKEELEDQAHWFSQSQVDRFQEAITQKTGNPNIAREAGRYGFSSEALGIAKHYMLGLLSLTSLYLLISKVYSVFSKAATITGKKISRNKVEIICSPKPGVREKLYQCQNRIGMFESVAKLFTSDFADIKHTSCFHRGASYCRYEITWKKKTFMLWKAIRNYSYLLVSAMLIISFPLIAMKNWVLLFGIGCSISLIFSLIPEILEKRELTNAIELQGELAKKILDEMEIRHKNALLIQDIGQAISSILNIDKLVQAIAKSMKNYMDYDRGLIMLTNSDNTSLLFKAGYGYDEEDEELLSKTTFNLKNPYSKGIFVIAYKKKKPFLINSIDEIENDLSYKSLKFARKMHAQSMICTPIVYEKDSLGILAVDNIRTKRPLTKSDLNFLNGVASQIAISINNAISYQKLQASESKYRDLVENANSIIMRRDIEGKIIFFNEFAQKLFDFNENEIIGKNFNDLFQKDRKSEKDNFGSIIALIRQNPNKTIINEEKAILKGGRQIWITWTYKPIFNAEGALFEILCIGNDITELKKAAIEKKQLEASLERARKMEALGTLAGGVAHDLNNILSGIVSYPELLLMDLPPESKLRRPLETIQKSGEKAAAIVQDLLTLARRGIVNRKIINLNDLIIDYLKSPEFEHLKMRHPRVSILHDLDKNLLNISGSPIHLTKTVMNLVTNAVESIENTGSVTIKTMNKYVSKVLTTFDKVTEGDYITLTIIDNGIGISEEDIERIFEPFYSKKKMGKSGTGLGMAVVWGTLKDHNGYIDVKSKEGSGTTFTIYFPATRKSGTEVEHPVLKEDLKGNGELLLIVDDVEEQREIAVKISERLNYRPVAVSSGEEGIDFVKKNSVDLLILDMILEGGMDGLETFKKILQINPNQKAIIVSGYSETDRVKEAQELGAGSYLKKPFILEDFAKSVKLNLK